MGVSIASLLKWALATPVQFYVGARFHTGAYKSLRNGVANMDVLAGGVIENNLSDDVESTINRNRNVREGEGKCSSDGLGIGRPSQTESARRYKQSP